MKPSVKARIRRLTTPTVWLLSVSGLTNVVVIAGDHGDLVETFRTVRSLSSSGRGPSFHLHLNPAKLVRSIGPSNVFDMF